MPLFWIVHEHEGDRSVFIGNAKGLLFARLQALEAGHKGEFVEALTLDNKTARTIGKKMIGRTLRHTEVKELLAKIGDYPQVLSVNEGVAGHLHGRRGEP